jgi:hypothetical protein
MAHGTWIPKAVLEKADISLSAKLLYGLVDALCQDEGCFASNEWVAASLGLKKRQIQYLLKELIDAGLVIRQEGERRVLWTVEKAALIKAARGAADCTPPVQSIAPPPCNELHPYNTVYNKEDNKEPQTPLPHGEKFKKAWEEWCNYRVKTRKRLSKFAAEKQIKMLAGMTENQAVACIEKSIANDWQGLFPDKQFNKPFSKILTKDDHNNGF